jgi:hypothetical protein
MVPTQAVRAYCGNVPYSTPAVTALDIANDLDLAAGLDNAATVIVDPYSESGLTGGQLAQVAGLYPAAATRKVGWILEEFAGADGLDRLQAIARADAIPRFPLDPDYPSRGPANPHQALPNAVYQPCGWLVVKVSA